MAALSRRRGVDRAAEKAVQRLTESIPPVRVVWLRQRRRVSFQLLADPGIYPPRVFPKNAGPVSCKD